MINKNHPNTLLTTKQAADYLGVSKSFLAKARVSGEPEIQFSRLGGCIRYRLVDLDAFVAANMACSTSEAA